LFNFTIIKPTIFADS